jgi:predicted permease
MRWRIIAENVAADGRSAWRTLRKSPGFVMVAMTSIALGVGANTAIFTLVDQVVLRLLPVARPQELVLLTSRGLQYGGGWGDGNELSYPMYEDLRDNNDVFTGMFCRFGIPLSISDGDRTERVASELVSGTYFHVLGVPAARGRVIEPGDDTAPDAQPVAVLSHGYWTDRFGADPAIIGRTLLINNHQMTVIGVTREQFDGTNLGKATQVFVAIRQAPLLTPIKVGLTSRRTRWVNVFGRLRPGVTPAQAQVALQPFYASRLASEVLEPGFARAAATVKERFLQGSIDVRPAGEGKSDLRRQFSRPLWVLMAIVSAVLLIACANVANLLLARATARQREIAIRLAIGASRRRIVQQLMFESIALALAGGAAGLLLARWGVRSLLGFFVSPERVLTVSAAADGRVLTFTLVVSGVTGLLFGLAPAWHSTSPALAPTLHSEAPSVGGSRARLRRLLVVSQMAVSLVLLVGTGLFTRTLHNLLTAEAGFDTAHILSFSAMPGDNGYSAVRSKQFLKTVIDRLQTTPGVAAVGVASHGLLEGGSWNNNVTIEGVPTEPGRNRLALDNLITPGYFKAMGMHLVSGRDFDARDERMAPSAQPNASLESPAGPLRSAIANERFVKQFLGGAAPLGRHIGFGSDPGTPTPIEIVGVVTDAKYTSIRDDIQPQLYFPFLEADAGGFVVNVRTADDPARMIGTVRQILHELDPSLPISDTRTFEERLNRSLTSERLLASLSAVFSTVATLLAMVGLYSVMAYLVALRTREVGIRMALGALASDVAWLVLRDVARITCTGIGIALPLAWGLSRLIRSQLYGITPNDPSAIALAIGLLMIVATIAGLIPATRAARTNPMVALRHD